MQMNDWIISLALKKRLEFFSRLRHPENLEMDVEFFFLQKETKKKEEEIWKKRIFNRPATKVKQFFFGRN